MRWWTRFRSWLKQRRNTPPVEQEARYMPPVDVHEVAWIIRNLRQDTDLYCDACSPEDGPSHLVPLQLTFISRATSPPFRGRSIDHVQFVCPNCAALRSHSLVLLRERLREQRCGTSYEGKYEAVD